MEVTLTQEQIGKLKNLAKHYRDIEEDFNPCDHFGGNFDDAYFGGISDGRADLAAELLNDLGIEYDS